jgi:lysophospholipase L1-like esterase
VRALPSPRSAWSAAFFHAELGRHLQQRQLQIYQDYNHIVRRIARRSGAHLLDLQALFANRSLGESPPLRMDDGVHLTPEGQQLIALAVMQALENTGLPSSEPDRRR